MNRGLALALAGALLLTPDAALMRLSGMDAGQMLAWRGLCMGAMFLAAWALTARNRRADLAALASPVAALVIACQTANATLFPLGIAAAPVAPVLLGVATVPVWAAVLARLLYGERTAPATWRAMAAVLAGIALAVSGHGDPDATGNALIGAACGIGVAMALGLNFVTLRHHPGLPLLPAIGAGALLAGLFGLVAATPARLTEGALLPILAAALLVLPLSFFLLSAAARHTSAATVSLLMLLETALGPLWVWLATAEAPSPSALAGGTVVIVALAVYLAPPRRARPLASASGSPRTGHHPAEPEP